MFHITDDQAQAAFDVLDSGDHAKCRAAFEYADKRLKVVLAKASLKAEGKTVGERADRAQISDEYNAALATWNILNEAYHEARDRREAAAAVIDAWRTQAADRRAMRNAA